MKYQKPYIISSPRKPYIVPSGSQNRSTMAQQVVKTSSRTEDRDRQSKRKEWEREELPTVFHNSPL